MSDAELARRVEAVRRFSRFYTRKLGLLREGLLDSPFSLTEGRVVYELAHHETTTASELARELGLDAGYLSRILKGFEKDGLIERRPSPSDGRRSAISLSEQGQAAFARLNARSRAQIEAMLDGLSEGGQRRLMAAMETVEDLLVDEPPRRVPFILRPHQPGDIGWVIQRHGEIYTREYGWDETFEGFVAEIAGKFLKDFDPKRERCWIAEKDGEIVGSVFLVYESDEVAKLRLLIVDARARDLGIGKRLIEECVRFARERGYGRITLGTNDVLVEARHLYDTAGFRLVSRQPHHSFGKDLVGETWEIDL